MWDCSQNQDVGRICRLGRKIDSRVLTQQTLHFYGCIQVMCRILYESQMRPTFARVGLPRIQELRLPSSFLLHASRPLLISGNLPFGSNRLAPRRAMKTSEVPLPNTDKRMEDEKKPPNPCPMPVHAPQCPGSPSSVLIFCHHLSQSIGPIPSFSKNSDAARLGVSDFGLAFVLDKEETSVPDSIGRSLHHVEFIGRSAKNP